MSAQARHSDDGLSPRAFLGVAGVLALVTAGLFWSVWRGQFTAGPGFLFDTPSRQVEAAYCWNVATGIVPGGAPIASYFDEAARFWVERLRKLDPDNMAHDIAEGHARLMADRAGAREKAGVWFQFAMDQCSHRAVTYGAHFRSFD